jgi:hypothetical protein
MPDSVPTVLRELVAAEAGQGRRYMDMFLLE